MPTKAQLAQQARRAHREWLVSQDLLEQQARTAQLAPRELLAHKDRKASQALRVQQAQQAQLALWPSTRPTPRHRLAALPRAASTTHLQASSRSV